MSRTSLRTRLAAIVGGAALVTTGVLAFAPAAHADTGAATATTTKPALLINAANQAFGNVTITESAVGTFTVGQAVCFTLDGGHTTFNTSDPQPTVSDNNAGSTETSPATFDHASVDNDTVKFTVNAVSTGSAATFTISNLRVDTDNTVQDAIKAEVGVCGQPVAQSNIDAGTANVRRIAGTNRYATAQAIAEFGMPSTPKFPCDTTGMKTFILARGDNFADALSASFLAGVNHVPILLTASGSLPNETIAALKDLGVQHLDVIGGSGAISDGVVNLIAATHAYNCSGGQLSNTISVNRVQGTDRYETAKAVALQGAGSIGTSDHGLTGTTCVQDKTAIVAYGGNFPDALAAGGLAYGGMHGCGNGPLPLLLTDTNTLSTATQSVLSDQGIKQVILMGGTGAISASVATAIANTGGTGNINVVRIAGTTRQLTAAMLDTNVLGDSHFGDYNSTAAFVARPDDFADALAAAPLLGLGKAPLFIADSTTSLGTTATNAIEGYPETTQFTEGDVLGGTAALSQTVVGQLSTAINNQT